MKCKGYDNPCNPTYSNNYHLRSRLERYKDCPYDVNGECQKEQLQPKAKVYTCYIIEIPHPFRLSGFHQDTLTKYGCKYLDDKLCAVCEGLGLTKKDPERKPVKLTKEQTEQLLEEMK